MLGIGGLASLIKVGLIVSCLGGLVTWCHLRDRGLKQEGASEALENVAAGTKKATEKAQKAGEMSTKKISEGLKSLKKEKKSPHRSKKRLDILN